jgi:5-methylthioadenosine/S-adenosylhomocysteine deaminase
MQKHGCSPTAYLESLDFFRVPTLAAHCVHLSDGDFEILAGRGVSVATNPVSNMKLGNGFAPASRLLKAGVNLCVGTDSAASNNSLNMFGELSMLSYIHKGLDENALSFTAEETLRCGILNGAKALGLDREIGAIQAGKKADLVLIDMKKPWLQPVNNLLFSLIYSANGSEADTVLIDGEIIMEKGQMKTLDEERIFYEVEKIRQKLFQ